MCSWFLDEMAYFLWKNMGSVPYFPQYLVESLAVRLVEGEPECGARELRRVVERELEMKLAEILLNYENRTHTLSAHMNNDNLVLAWH
jgi:ATP-dependent Clp protease ATP-binding subunit ClpA